jgi:hypothetical protein
MSKRLAVRAFGAFAFLALGAACAVENNEEEVSATGDELKAAAFHCWGLGSTFDVTLSKDDATATWKSTAEDHGGLSPNQLTFECWSPTEATRDNGRGVTTLALCNSTGGEANAFSAWVTKEAATYKAQVVINPKYSFDYFGKLQHMDVEYTTCTAAPVLVAPAAPASDAGPATDAAGR